VDTLLVAGIDTVVGANAAAWLANRYKTIALSWSEPIAIYECETSTCDPVACDAASRWIQATRPHRVIYCGPAARSAWDGAPHAALRPEAIAAAGAWASAASQSGASFQAVSSDAIFTGPWMFHRENGACYCTTQPARLIRLIEREILAVNAKALVVRTNAFGWPPTPRHGALAQIVLDALSREERLPLDCARHATPILATDLVEILEKAHAAGLAGVYHAGGGERINPFRFGCLIAEQFGLPMPLLEATTEGRTAFGGGETSLQCRRLKKALDVATPLVREGIARLHEQHTSGYRERFGAGLELAPVKVA
jgi:dTDP-4-dehydrorhamnose reductase